MANAYSATKAARWLPLVAGALVLAAQPAMAQQRSCEVAEVAGDGRHELFKSTTNFDGPHHRKQHGFAT